MAPKIIEPIIYCHSNRDYQAVVDYIDSPHYKTIRQVGGAEFSFSKKPLDCQEADVVIAPGNSFGIMTGGFDQGLVDVMGSSIQDRVTNLINNAHCGELNVGAAVVAWTSWVKIPYCAYAPTMRTPTELPVDSDIPYVATRAALLAILGREINWPPSVWNTNKIHVLIPLMGVGTGGLDVGYVCSQIQLALASVALNSHKIKTLEQGASVDRLLRFNPKKSIRGNT